MVGPLYVASGFGVGFLVGMAGVGGGSLMTPLLILLFGIHPATAVGTDLLFAATTKTAGGWIHGINRTIDWVVVRRLAAGSVPMAVITMCLLGYLDINGVVARDIITAFLAVALFITAIVLLYRKWIIDRYADRIGSLSSDRIAAVTVGV